MDDKLVQIQKLLDAADGNLSSARTMIREMAGDTAAPLDMESKLSELTGLKEDKVTEGVFDGEMMIAPDGQTYPIPPNYASKSKLVEGDTLKLTIAGDGSFVFKQIAPVERRNAIGTLALTDGNYTISAEGKSYKVLTASVTFYKAEPGDQVTIILPKEHDAMWAVMENVIKKGNEEISRHSEPSEESRTTDPRSLVPTQDDVASTPVIPSAAKESLSTASAEEILKPVQDDVVAEAEAPVAEPAIPEIPVAPVPETPVTPANDEPNIEFPAGISTEVSDEELLTNLKNNLRNLDQPAYTPPQNMTTRPVDNIVASDMAAISGQSQPVATQAATKDQPIAELDI